jgi:hypothetical protein
MRLARTSPGATNGIGSSNVSKLKPCAFCIVTAATNLIEEVSYHISKARPSVRRYC